MDYEDLLLVAFLIYGLVIIAVVIIIGILIWIFKSPFKYPYMVIKLDISGKRAPAKEDLIDKYLNENGFSQFLEHYEYIKRWKNECQDRIAQKRLKHKREKQFLACLDDEHMFCFELTRSQTRYQQRNYVKTSYRVKVTVAQFAKSFDYLEARYKALKNIGFECTLSEYNAKNQRKLMTKALREEIAVRDNYTCQICGKYMPDGVGLHIDHIIPIAKGGKSIPSNLQVLCSKCNGRKSKK